MSAAPALDNRAFCEICTPENVLDPAKSAQVVDLLGILDRKLATDAKFRQHVGEGEPPIWTSLCALWSTVAGSILADGEDSLQAACLSLAKFTRNLVAGVPSNQKKAYEIEPDLRRLLYHYTSYYALQEDSSSAVARMLGQTLCNIVTANEDLLSLLWGDYLEIPEEGNILIRLLGCHRPDVLLPGEIIVLNCIHENRDRMSSLLTKPVGIRICIALLDLIRQASDEEPDRNNQVFEVGYSIFKNLIECGEVPQLYTMLVVRGEAITPHQTTLLKLLDAYLQTVSGREAVLLYTDLARFLLSTFSALSTYAQTAIRKSLGSTSPNGTSGAQGPSKATSSHSTSAVEYVEELRKAQQQPLQELDLLLPKVSEALVLASQCLITITLSVSASAEYSGQQRADVMTQVQEPEIVETLIETLRLLDIFLPRINFGKAVSPHGLELPSYSTESESAGFGYVKRDLVRLLAILCHKTRSVQDVVRNCGGIPVIMNMCVIDERNPFLREHAIFCLRNLLHGNPENQALVNEVQPLWISDEMGQVIRT